MGTEIEPQSCTGPRVLAPALAYVGAKTVHVALIVRDFAKHARLQDRLGGKHFTVPAPVVKDREQPLVLLCNLGEGASFGEGDGEGLVDDDVLPCPKAGSG